MRLLMLRESLDRWLTLSALCPCGPANAVQIGVISGVGVRKYYERFGYRIHKDYQVGSPLVSGFMGEKSSTIVMCPGLH